MWVTINYNHGRANAFPNSTAVIDQAKNLDKPHYLSDLIPKDTVFAFGHEPRWEQASQPTSNYWVQIQKFGREVRSNVEKKSENWTEEEQKVWRNLSSLPFPNTETELAELGISSTSAFWLYGLGIIPAFVMEVQQPKKLRAWAHLHIQSRAHGFKLVPHHQGEYWRKEMKRWVLLVRLKAKRLHVSLLPKKSEPILLSYFLRDQQKASLSSELRNYFQALPQGRGSGLIKINNLIDMFFGSQVPLLQHSGKALGLPMPIFSSCEQDFRRFAGQFTLLSFGLHEVTAQNLSILTHIHLEQSLHASLSPSFNNLMPVYLPKRSNDFGALSLRLNMMNLISYAKGLGQNWQSEPWTCPLFSSFNEWPKFSQRPEINMLSGLIGELKGLSLMMHKIPQDKVNPGPSDPQVSTTLGKSDNNFDIWTEILHPTPQLLLNMVLSLWKIQKLPNSFYQLDGQLKDISFLNTRWSHAYLSLSDQKLMFSLGPWGKVKHTQMIEQNRQNLIETQSSGEWPFLHFSLPPTFSAWLEKKLINYQNKSRIQAKSKPLLESSDQAFRAVELYFTQIGFLLKVHVDLVNKP